MKKHFFAILLIMWLVSSDVAYLDMVYHDGIHETLDQALYGEDYTIDITTGQIIVDEPEQTRIPTSLVALAIIIPTLIMYVILKQKNKPKNRR
ncbi:MAG: hypothetical protein FWB74_01855 [Defluviitaleaceae bacterium]|nr:hypothetical protein [Defluviitaleaceae bacterium]